MSFAHVGNVGTATAKAAGATLTMNPTSTVPVGDLLAIWVAWDNDTSVASATVFTVLLKCEDSQGNIYCSLFEANATGTSNKVQAALFLTQLETQLTASDTITVTCFTTTLVAKAMSAERFSMDANFMWARNVQDASAFSAVDPPAIGISSLQNRPHLLLHLLGSEGPSSDAFTWDADYTQITAAGTTGGGDDTNMTILGGWRIATLTADTVDVTSDTADRDTVQFLMALDEVVRPPVFPIEPILDNFNRADENPLDNGDWRTDLKAGICNTPPGANAPGFLQIISNKVQVDNLGHVDDTGGSWWSHPMACNEQEAYVTISTMPSDTSVPQTFPTPNTNGIGRGAGVIIHGQPGFGGCRTGIEAKWERRTRLSVDDLIRFGDSQFFTVLPYIAIWRDMADGVKIGVSKYAYYAYCWIDEGGGWKLIAAINYQQISNGPDDVYLGLDLLGSETIVDDFGGGDSNCFTPQIYRRVNAN